MSACFPQSSDLGLSLDEIIIHLLVVLLPESTLINWGITKPEKSQSNKNISKQNDGQKNQLSEAKRFQTESFIWLTSECNNLAKELLEKNLSTKESESSCDMYKSTEFVLSRLPDIMQKKTMLDEKTNMRDLQLWLQEETNKLSAETLARKIKIGMPDMSVDDKTIHARAFVLNRLSELVAKKTELEGQKPEID